MFSKSDWLMQSTALIIISYSIDHKQIICDTVENSKINAANANINPLTQAILVCMWKHTVEKMLNKCIKCEFAPLRASHLRRHNITNATNAMIPSCRPIWKKCDFTCTQFKGSTENAVEKSQWNVYYVFMHQTPWHLLTEVLRGPFKNAQKGEIMWAMWLFIFSGRHLKTHSEEKLITLILNSKTQKQNILPCVSTCVKMAGSWTFAQAAARFKEFVEAFSEIDFLFQAIPYAAWINFPRPNINQRCCSFFAWYVE